ncbi:MAG: hypothetical protein GC154_00725 [bacterium]|nr:hypothetical protein [bacterium]
MYKRFGIAVIAAALAAQVGFSQEIKTVFLTTHNDDGSVLPILIKKGRTLDAGGTEIGSWADGTRTQDRYFGLKRYDDTRLLLGVFGNGINENDPNDNQALAAQFPDRSLIWIDAGNGKPLGVALNIGVQPVAPSQAYLDAYGSIPFFMAFDVSDEGYIYVAFGEYILRYKPDGNGGFTGPETVFTLDVATYGPEDWGTNTLSVRGSGVNTIITGGQNGTGFYLTTDDGDNFKIAFTYTRTGWPPIGGPQSNLIHNTELKEEYVMTGGYGNNSGGNDSKFYRLVRNYENTDEPFGDDSDFFKAEGMPDAGDLDYRAEYIGAIAGLDDFPYVAAYSTPSWNTEIKTSPGFIGLHDMTEAALGGYDGAYVTSIMIPVYTSEEPRLPNGTTSSWYGTQGTLELNVPDGAPEGAFEIIWGGGIYGYGRFVVGDIDTHVSDWSLF